LASQKKFSLPREELKRVWRDMRGTNASPARLGFAVALGLFIGTQPIFGCHTPLVLFICLWLGLDAALAWVAANISNPFFAPALLTAEVQVGAVIRTGGLIRIDREVQAGWSWVSDFAGYAFLGAPVVGLAFALVGGVVTWGGVSLKRRFMPPGAPLPPYRLPPEAPPWVQAAERVASRYASPESPSPQEKTQFHYVRIKLMSDPVARLIADIEGEREGALGEVLDIGTGRGQLPILLLELGRATRAHGVDWDEAKIEVGRRAAQSQPDGRPALPASFERGDARGFQASPADTVLLIDLLHYFKIEEQDAILACAADHVRPGGRLLVREADTERGARSFATLLEERFFTTLRFNRGERVRFRPAREIAALLEARGLRCEVRPAWGKTPFSNVLILAHRPAAPEPPSAA
jgi:uncharacterized protein (DUF2062 family)/2-polyprenyl-3-methyl-5-hydroxy-6-metoxy-1,4-benzoquinol methylase